MKEGKVFSSGKRIKCEEEKATRRQWVLWGKKSRRDLITHKGYKERRERRPGVLLRSFQRIVKKGTCKLNLGETKEVRLPVKLPTRRWKTTASWEAFFREIRSQTEMLVRE